MDGYWQTLSAALYDAATFVLTLPSDAPAAIVTVAEDGEVALDWRGQRRAIADFDGSGTFGYALWDGAQFQPGRSVGLAVGPLPPDLRAALTPPPAMGPAPAPAS